MTITTQVSPDALDSAAIRQQGDADILRIADDVAAFCAQNAAAVDYEGAFPVEEFALIARSGLLVAPLRRALGGSGVGSDEQQDSTLTLLRLLKKLGRGNLSVGRVYEGHVNALQLIQTFGAPAQVERAAADARDGHKLFGVWNTEAAGGVRIIPAGKGHYRLMGAKTFTSGAGHVARALVPGALVESTADDAPVVGWQMCLVPMDAVRTEIDPSFWRPLGMRASASYRVVFDGVELPAEALIGQPGDYYRQPWFSGGAIRFAAVQLGGAEALFDAARDYLRELDRTSDPHQRARLGEAAILVESGDLWLRGAASLFDAHAELLANGTTEQPDANDTARRLVAYANMARTAIERVCLDVMRLVERSVGARGLLQPRPFERIHRDLTVYLRQPAPDAALDDVGAYALERAGASDALWTDESR